jgi:hypothetical protein
MMSARPIKVRKAREVEPQDHVLIGEPGYVVEWRYVAEVLPPNIDGDVAWALDGEESAMYVGKEALVLVMSRRS